ncbi:NACHT domain- and WD repeat-containing protein 1-like [Dreissena polymorpha]|uniref:NACHT domain- and WD repeat-containing protein 1-like n=1 Tax=Dreissena polymorpha TaxID=45954 RepID=UPI002264F234|nr:NACHT domain- and WD repeat-containing protein 1-like [Dreissena polymorpha]
MAALVTERVFSGSMEDLPAQVSNVVQVFISSTFTDFQEERNWIMKHAVPRLRKFCQERGLDFQIADMRWGVREDAIDDHRTTEMCLHTIHECQRISRGPNFVAFLGDKYGFRPFPSEIEEEEFKLLKNAALKLGQDPALLLTWFKCDYNMEPTMYCLQPISSQYSHYFDMSPANSILRQQAQKDWWNTVEKLTGLLRNTADSLHFEGKLSFAQRHKYFMSVTESEVQEGLLSGVEVKHKAVCFIRRLDGIEPTHYISGRFTDLKDGGVDLEAQELRERLCMELVPSVIPPSQLYRYTVPWDGNKGVSTANEDQNRYINQLGEDFITSLEEIIKHELNESETARFRTPLFEEILHHVSFAKTKCTTFCGRDNLIKEVHDKVNKSFTLDDDIAEVKTEDAVLNMNKAMEEAVKQQQLAMSAYLKSIGVTYVVGDEYTDMESDSKHNPRDTFTEIPVHTKFNRPLIIIGKSGSGKTAIMAKLFQTSPSFLSPLKSITMVRFLGTSTMSTSIRETLITLCEQIRTLYKVQDPFGLDFESDYQFLVRYFASLLWRINTTNRPLTIILDSADQLNVADHAHLFNWLPHKLPVTVRMIVSLVTDRTDCLTNIRLVFPFVDRFVEITDLDRGVADNIINMTNKAQHRHLSKKQKNFVLEQFAKCCLPLYLKVLVDMSLSWRSYTDLDPGSLGSSIKEAIKFLFNNLEKAHGEVLVRKSLGYLCAARDGLSEIEIEDLLSLDDEVLQDTYIYHLPPDPEVIRLPPLLWKRVQFDIREYVVERQSGGRKVIGWYHRQFSEVAYERFCNKDVRQHLHKALAEYFQGIWSTQCKPLQLIKGKKGSYTKAVRQVPSQPIKISETLYNTRKLTELPHHLINSGQFETVLNELFCDPDWLYAKCLILTLTSVMEDLKLADALCNELLRSKMAGIKASSSGKQKNTQDEVVLETERKVLEGIRLVSRMILLAADSIRKDPVNLPVMLLAQFGPDYSGNEYIEGLVRRCQDWCSGFRSPLLVPVLECMSKPTGNQQYSISVDLSLIGEDRDPHYRPAFLRDDLGQLYVVEQRSSQRCDRICVFDLHDNGSCIVKDDIGMFIRNIQFVGGSKYLLLDVYTKVSRYSPESEHRLYERSTSAPIQFPHPVGCIVVSNEGKFIVCSNDTGITNGVENKYAGLVDINNGKMVGKVPEGYKGPYSSARVFGTEDIYYAVGVWNNPNVSICYAGTVNEPLEEAVVIHVLIGHNGPMRDTLVDSSLELLITLSADNTVKVWDLKAILHKFRSEMQVLERALRQSAVLENGEDHVTLRDVAALYQPTGVATMKYQTTTLALNRSGESVYVGTEGGRLQVYETDTGKQSLDLKLEIGHVTKMELSRDGRYMIVAGNRHIHVEDLYSQARRVLEARGEVTCMAEANHVLVAGSAGMEAKARVWNIVTGEILKDFELLYSLNCVAINSSGTKIVSSMFEFPIVVSIDNSTQQGVDMESMDIMMTGACSCAISHDDKMAAMGATDGAVRVIAMETGKYLFRLQQKSSAVCLVFATDGVQLLSAGYRTIYVWSTVDGTCMYKLTRHLDFVNDMKFDTTGQFLVTISRDKQVVLWDYTRRVSIATFPANCQVQAVDISSGATVIAYIPKGISDLAILQPNHTTLETLAGKPRPLHLPTQMQALAQTFSNLSPANGPGKASKSCEIM